MKSKIHKIMGVGLTLVLALALVAGFALPVAAAETINEWYKFDYPVEGEPGDWFYDDDIDEIRELTEAINGDLYVYVELDTPGDHIFKSEDGGRTWAETKYSDPDDGVVGGRVFDMVCSSIDEDIVYVTDGCYIYKTDDGGDTWSFVARDSLEAALVGELVGYFS
ncbi:unnamed protein product [marine sediment metagenome]|uniref:Photosynthesis system II assembly factor Ycf48/Hcf136-like domain-containing protein n=1 Tax=marine sediment metagenome TaxID=412755 RepID=X1G0G9_9ZZZZ